MLKGFKYRLYPTQAQALLINRHIGSCRFIYNLALETKSYAYASHRKNLTCFDLTNQLPDLKNECEWLREIDSQALQQSVINLDKAFKAFFKGHAKFPNFKKKNGSNQIPTFEPSTKPCNCCGAINNTLTLADREWVCVNCGTLHDRDINAAINIKNYSLKNRVGLQRGKSAKLPINLVGAIKQKEPAFK